MHANQVRRKVPTLRGSLPSAGDLNGRTVDVTGPRRGGIKFRDRCISERRGRGTPPSVRNNGERAMKRKTRARESDFPSLPVPHQTRHFYDPRGRRGRSQVSFEARRRRLSAETNVAECRSICILIVPRALRPNCFAGYSRYSGKRNGEEARRESRTARPGRKLQLVESNCIRFFRSARKLHVYLGIVLGVVGFIAPMPVLCCSGLK